VILLDDDEVGIGSRREGALSGIKAEGLGGVVARDPCQLLERNSVTSNTLTQERRQDKASARKGRPSGPDVSWVFLDKGKSNVIVSSCSDQPLSKRLPHGRLIVTSSDRQYDFR
jgi:3-isopropylmalate dehydratase small subunit